MSKIYVIGVDSLGLSARQEQILGNCGLIVAGKRLMSQVEVPDVSKRNITPLTDALDDIRDAVDYGNVGVLASGDPLFFGIGRRLLSEFDSSKIDFMPALSTMQEAFSRFKLPWDDVRPVSLHGRTSDHLAGLLLRYPKSFVFTDSTHSPDVLAKSILQYCHHICEPDLPKKCRIWVAENIGDDKERIIEGSLQEIAGGKFADLNVVCILVPDNEKGNRLGLTEKELAHSRGLITKDEVRAATLHRLRLPKTGIFWDVGAGSGSVSIEAACINPDLTVYAIERKKEELDNIRENIRRHRCYNVVPIAGEAPDSCLDLPDPDVVFVGGSGGNLEKIVAEVGKRLPMGGRLVVNGVIERTVTDAPKYMADNNLSVECSTLHVSRTGQAIESVVFNPITIMVGSK